MRPALAYSLARLGLFLAAVALLYLVGARGLLLVALALLVSGIISFVVLSRQRDAMSSSLSTRLRGMRARVGDFGEDKRDAGEIARAIRAREGPTRSWNGGDRSRRSRCLRRRQTVGGSTFGDVVRHEVAHHLGIDDRRLSELARHCTLQEDNAAKVERRVRKSAAALLLGPRVGQTFDAIVTGAGEKGTWVRTCEPAAEGKVVKGFDGLRVGCFVFKFERMVSLQLVIGDGAHAAVIGGNMHLNAIRFEFCHGIHMCAGTTAIKQRQFVFSFFKNI